MLGTGQIPDALTEILTNLFQMVCEDGGGIVDVEVVQTGTSLLPGASCVCSVSGPRPGAALTHGG